MVKGKLAVCCLAAFGLLCATGIAHAGIVNLCNSTASVVDLGIQPGSLPLVAYVCPSGDGVSFGSQGFYISLTIQDGLGVGIPNILPADIWVDDCDPINDLLLLCVGSTSSSADSMTNALGKTTLSNTSIAASRLSRFDCAPGLIVVVQGGILDDPTTSCSTKLCLPIQVKSFDLGGVGLKVDLSDVSAFAQAYPPNPFNDCIDYNNSDSNNLPDLSIFAIHFKGGLERHQCFGF